MATSLTDVVPASATATQPSEAAAAVQPSAVAAAAPAVVDSMSATDAAPAKPQSASLFGGALCGDAERSVLHLLEEHCMRDVLTMRRVCRSWLCFVDSQRTYLSYYEAAVKSKLWKAWSLRWEQLRRLEMPCVDLAQLMAHGLGHATNLSHVQVYCTDAAILRDFAWNLPGLQHLDLFDSCFTYTATRLPTQLHCTR